MTAGGLRPARGGLADRLRSILGIGGDQARTWEAIEEALIAADVGPGTAAGLVQRAAAIPAADPIQALRRVMLETLAGSGAALPFALGPPPTVVLVVGVNGTGKTTTAGKLAARWHADGHSALLVAADTFRAAAIEQLRLLGERSGVPVLAQRAGADPAAVAFDALDAAAARGTQVVVIDTAGRLHTEAPLMAELAKVRRVVTRRWPDQPAHVLLVIDATTGQNGLVQAETFGRELGVSGVVLTKMDGTAKGGIGLAIADRLGLPIVFIGIGEGLEALAPFDAEAYVDWLLGR